MNEDTRKKLEEVEEIAKWFYGAVDRVKGSVSYPVYQTDDRGNSRQVATETVQISGYAKAKAVAASLKEEVPVEVYDDPKYAPEDMDVVTGGPVDDTIPF